MSVTKPTILYISYNGILSGVGKSQILPYLLGLSDQFVFHLITMEQETRQIERSLLRSLSERGIHWRPLLWHRRPWMVSKFAEVLYGASVCLIIAQREPIDLVHARGYPAALIALVLRSLGKPYLFDIRGLLADEYAECGHWQRQWYRYRLLKRLEPLLMYKADGFVVLTEKMRTILKGPGWSNGRPVPIAVIPSCVDPQRFSVDRLEQRELMGVPLSGRFVVIYLGSTTLGEKMAEMVDFFAEMRRVVPSAFFAIFTSCSHAPLMRLFEERNISVQDYLIAEVPFEEIPTVLKQADLAVNFVEPTFSKQASSSIKKAEYLASGLPLVLSAGAEDHDELVAEYRVGVLVKDFTRHAYHDALEGLWLLMRDRGLPQRCREAARQRYGLQEVGIPRYAQLYRELLGCTLQDRSNSGSGATILSN